MSKVIRLTVDAPARTKVQGTDFTLRLLGGWELEIAVGQVCASPGGRHFLALLALRGRQLRVQVASTLWPDSPDRQAAGSLRELLWRVKRAHPGLVDVRGDSLQLGSRVDLDVARLADAVQAMAASPDIPPDHVQTLLAGGELLPSWQEHWVIPAREQVRETQLHGLELLADRCLDAGRHHDSLSAAMAVVHREPLRESGHKAVLRAHLAMGNYGRAVTHFERTTEQLMRELGVPPSRDMADLLRDRVAVAVGRPPQLFR